MKILAVDDDPFILELLPLVAAKAGFPDVTTSLSGHRALQLISDSRTEFSCFLLDLNMPAMDGIELCSRIRKIEAYRQTPIIMLTAMSERHTMQSAFRAGATDYATKPFDINELGARLRVAAELVQARKVSRIATEQGLAGATGRGRNHTFDIAEAFVFEGVQTVVGFGSFKNYLKQNVRSELSALQLIAINVHGIVDLYDRASSAEFVYALREVADAVNMALLTKESLLSYAGGGVFVAVTAATTSLIGVEIEADIQQGLDQKNSEFDNGAPMDIEVSVGNPVQLDFTNILDVQKSIDCAVAWAGRRASTKRDAHREQGYHRNLREG